ncbi:hypothetical protein yc1106_09711 [Curvularia clavata]|uniref:Uncharacterized protein n=1 Tax=Curvularia clavata TaxID=95742 RepID=A0A9Q8ZFI8_CURCL|nr:hypothetical protein yc1106_09711 [Curvularia clavata]
MVSRVSSIPTPALPAVVAAINFNVAITVASAEWKLVDCQSNRFLYDIRSEVLRYRLKSPSRFAVPIEVGQVIAQNVDQLLYPHLSLWVGFYNFGRNPVFAICRPAIRMRRDGSEMPTGSIETYSQKRGSWMPLEQFLKTQFPPIKNTPVGASTVFEWWGQNGQFFNWPGLPNELKEDIVRHCYNPLPRVMINRRRGPVLAQEVTEKFGQWVTLLRVSSEVRAICLRICFVGSTGIRMEVKEPGAFKKVIRRLNKCHQMLLPGGLPTDRASQQTMELYRLWPRIYPELQQYATLYHAIRKIALFMSFLNYMHFFRVTAGSFAQYHRASWVSYHMFESMPHLKEIQIKLPDAREDSEDSERQLGPRLFHDRPYSCPRTLHRLIYERVAETLAVHDNVRVYNFMEGIEETRFYQRRQEEQAKLKITLHEMEELYREDRGGIQLEKWVSPGAGDHLGQIGRQPTEDPFWPPRCRCPIRCHDFLFPSII